MRRYPVPGANSFHQWLVDAESGGRHDVAAVGRYTKITEKPTEGSYTVRETEENVQGVQSVVQKVKGQTEVAQIAKQVDKGQTEEVQTVVHRDEE